MKHPGQVLLDEYLTPLGLTANRLALALHLSPQRVGEILNGRRGISAETALRLAKLFGTTPRSWLDLQSDYELSQAEDRWAPEIDRDIRPIANTTTTSAVPARRGGQGVGRSSGQSSGQSSGRPPGRPPAPVKLTDSQRKIYDLLSDSPVHFDVLCRRTGMSAGEVSATITMLELSMLVTCHPGNRYARSGVNA